jgi:protein TonB
MEIKKTKRADLEGSKTPSFLMGIIIGCAVLFVGFEWGTRDVQAVGDSGIAEILTEEDIEITRPEDTPPPPPPPPAPAVVEVLNVVEDNVEIEQQEIESTEDIQSAAQQQTYVAPAAAIQEEEEESAQQIFTIVEENPQFPGGEGEMIRFLYGSIRYPVIAQENGIQGRVTCTFVINRDGSIVDAQVVRGVDPSLDKEALRVINSMPKWSPGKQRGKPVRVRFTLPVTFKLQ